MGDCKREVRKEVRLTQPGILARHGLVDGGRGAWATKNRSTMRGVEVDAAVKMIALVSFEAVREVGELSMRVGEAVAVGMLIVAGSAQARAERDGTSQTREVSQITASSRAIGRLSKELTADQKAKVAEAMETMAKRMKEAHTEFEATLENILTPEQMEKYEKAKTAPPSRSSQGERKRSGSRQGSRRGGRGGGGGGGRR